MEIFFTILIVLGIVIFFPSVVQAVFALLAWVVALFVALVKYSLILVAVVLIAMVAI